MSLLGRLARRLGLRRDCRVIWAGHGVVAEHDARSFLHRNAVSREAFARFLEARAFGNVDDALGGRADALTVDDATRASADAALMARERGHAVTLYVNPGVVERARAYWFTRMDVALDGTRAAACRFDGRDFALGDRAGKVALRAAVRARARAAGDPDAIVGELERALGTVDTPAPRAFAPLTRAELAELLAAGVTLGNHGWEHADAADAPALAENLGRGRAWLAEHLGVAAPDYCAPFGDTLPPGGVTPGLFRAWLLLDAARPPGALPGGAFNRTAIDSRMLALDGARSRLS